jgi:hypothetical protein
LVDDDWLGEVEAILTIRGDEGCPIGAAAVHLVAVRA